LPYILLFNLTYFTYLYCYKASIKYLTRASKDQSFEVLESLKNTERFALSKTESTS
jgi:hypothetical protein